MSDTEYNVFVSYNHDDREMIERLVAALQQDGIGVWWDAQIAPGQLWLSEIDRQFKTDSAFLVCVGPKGIGNWQRQEIEHALNKEIRGDDFRVIPVLIPGGWERREELPALLTTHQRVQFKRSIDDEPSVLRQLTAAIDAAPPV